MNVNYYYYHEHDFFFFFYCLKVSTKMNLTLTPSSFKKFGEKKTEFSSLYISYHIFMFS